MKLNQDQNDINLSHVLVREFVQNDLWKHAKFRNNTMTNILFHCDNIEAMEYLIKNGFENKIVLIYIDPPFLTRDKYFFENPGQSKARCR